MQELIVPAGASSTHVGQSARGEGGRILTKYRGYDLGKPRFSSSKTVVFRIVSRNHIKYMLPLSCRKMLNLSFGMYLPPSMQNLAVLSSHGRCDVFGVRGDLGRV